MCEVDPFYQGVDSSDVSGQIKDLAQLLSDPKLAVRVQGVELCRDLSGSADGAAALSVEEARSEITPALLRREPCVDQRTRPSILSLGESPAKAQRRHKQLQHVS